MQGHTADSGASAAWPVWAGRAAGAFLGAVLVLAAWAKMLDPEAFARTIRQEGLDLLVGAMPVAYLAIALEVGLGLALLLGLRRWWVLAPTTGMVVFFLFLTFRTYWRFRQGLVDESASCGCFGNLMVRTPSEAFYQDLFLLALPLVLAFAGLRREAGGFPRRRLALAAAAVVASLLFTWQAPELPLDDLATRLKPGVPVAGLCAGAESSEGRLCLDALIEELEQGRHWVIIASLEEEGFRAGLEALSRFALEQGEIRLWVITSDPPETVSTFAWTVAPPFEVREVPEALLLPLVRRTPRSFLVENGSVIETVGGLPPFAG